MKTSVTRVLVVLALAVRAARAEPDVLEHVVAVVGDDPVTAADLEVASTPGMPPLDSAIDERLLVREAERMGVIVRPDEVEAVMKTMAAHNGLSRAAFDAAIVSRFTMAQYREHVRQQLMEARALLARASGRDTEAVRKEWLERLRQTEYIERHESLPVDREPSFTCWTAPTSADGPRAPVARIEVSGQRRLVGKGLCAYFRPPVGASLDRDALEVDVKRLWKNELLDDLAVVRRTTPGGVVLRFIVRERPVISRVSFDANSALSDADMLRLAPLTPGLVLDPQRLHALAAELAAETRSRGKPKSVTTEVLLDGETHAHVHFIVR